MILSPVRKSLSLLVALVFLVLTGCGTVSYLSQATAGHYRIMRNRVPIENVLKESHLSVEGKDKLKLVLEVRAYAAEELGLPRNKSYTTYSEINSEYPGWNVYAAPEFSVEPVKWCFPIAGCVTYRGYFSKKGALEFAREMEKKGFNVFVGPFNAYSTLGWSDDPVLSSQLRLNPIRLAGLVIHELAHQKIYVSGDSRFNEGFAVTVERAGVLRWLRSTGRDALVAQALEMWDEEDRMVSEILRARARLMDLYQSELDAESLVQRKASIFRELRTDLCRVNCAGMGLSRMNGEGSELNNAYLVPIDTYYSLVPVFERMLSGLNGSLPQFFKKVEELGRLPLKKRKHKLEATDKDLRENH